MGGGFPIAAFGGRQDVMDALAPKGGVYQAGTLSGNPVASAAGLRTLQLTRELDVYPTIEAAADVLRSAITEALSAEGVPHTIQSANSMFSVFFTDREVRTFADAQAQNTAAYSAFFLSLIHISEPTRREWLSRMPSSA